MFTNVLFSLFNVRLCLFDIICSEVYFLNHYIDLKMMNVSIYTLNLNRFSIPCNSLLHRAYNYKLNERSIQEDLITSSIKANKIPSSAEWLLIKQNVLAKGKNICKVSIDAQTLGLCIKEKNYEAGKSFLQSIQSEGKDINLAALGKFMRLYYVCSEILKSNTDEEFILALFNDLQEKYPVIDAITAENVIHAISLTRKWRKCLNLLDTMKLTVIPSSNTYSVIIAAAFINNDEALGWKLIEEMLSVERLPEPVVYHAWLYKGMNINKNLSHTVETLFRFFSENEILPTKDVTDKCVKILQSENFFGRYTKIFQKGTCQCCKTPLQKVKISDSEFNQLKTIFMENVIIGKNLFNKTTPEELKKFLNFISDIGSYDIVIDGLNVAYSAGNKKNSHFYARLLASVVRHYRAKSKKLLILGREHMNKWPNSLMDYVRSNSKMFLTQNLSQDDPFILYATMSSGLGTSFLSRDLMRGHLYLLMNPDLKRIFRKWQQIHQHSIQYVEDSGQVHIKSPSKFLCATQTSKDGWHLPYTDLFTNNRIDSLEPPVNWLCLQKKF